MTRVALGAQANGFTVARAGAIRGSARDVVEQAGQRTRPRRIDQPEPAVDHVLGRDLAAVAVADAGAQLERELAAVIGRHPARRKRRLDVAVRIERRQALVDLGVNAGRAGITGERPDPT